MRLTDTKIKQLPAPATGNRITFDEVVKGLGIRVTANGARAFVLDYRRKSDGRQRRITIGSFPDWSTVAARDEAKRLKREIDGGADPIGEQEATRAAPTVADLCARFVEDYLPRKRPSTQASYRQQIATDILPALGKMKVAAVSYTDVERLHREMSKRAPYHANRVLAVLSKMFSLAIRWKLRTDHPVKGIERNKEHRRKKYLSPAQLIRLANALDGLRDQGAADALRLLLLTGARRGESLAAKWADIDLETGVWSKPASTVKTNETHVVPLSSAARDLLARMRKQAPKDAVWLFPAPKKGGHRTDIKEAWEIIRRDADIREFRTHDLRHSYASVLASAGQSLPVIGALLGHATPTTTARYAHLFDDPLRAATEKAAAIITARPSAEVVRLKK